MLVSLVVASGDPSFGYAAAHSLSRRCQGIDFIFDEAQRRGRLHSKLSRLHWQRFDGSNRADLALAETIERLAAKFAPCVLIPSDVPAALAVNRIRANLTCAVFPVPKVEHILKFDHKDAFIEYCTEIGVDVPKTINLVDKHAASFGHLSSSLGLPFVIKPTNKYGGAGYKLISSKADFEQGVQDDCSYSYRPLIAQEFVPGKDIDISLFAIAGEIRHIAVQIPDGRGGLLFIPNESAVALAQRLVQRSNYCGLLHLDGRLDERDSKIKLVEANPRSWSSIRAAAWCGLDFIEAGVAVVLGEPTVQPATITEGVYPGLTRTVTNIAMRRTPWSCLKPHQRQLLKMRLTDVRYVCRRALATLNTSYVNPNNS